MSSPDPSDERTSSRKKQHVDVIVQRNVTFKQKSTGFEDWEFEHNALPELNLDEIDTSIVFLGKRLSFPLMVTGMTGGYADALRINAQLAEVCNDLVVAIGAGSQRQALEDERFHHTYCVLREKGKDIPIVANLGASEVASIKDLSVIQGLVDQLEADAFAIHLNPLQELLQPEGSPRFRDVLVAIERLVTFLQVPVLVKEVGAGISGAVAQRLFDAGVRIIDVAGAGGTSWAGVEMLRRSNQKIVSEAFWDWGIPTVESLMMVRAVAPDDGTIIASGGIEDGVMIAKAIALGANLAGTARPALQALESGGQEALRNRLLGWRDDLAGVMFLTGSLSIEQLSTVPIQRRA